MSFRQQNQWKKFGGAGCLVLNYYNRQWTPLLGLQRGGKRQGKFNICSGKMEQQDNCCYVATVIRELNEEFKLQITEKSLQDQNGNFRVFYHNGSPIFILLAIGLSRKHINLILMNDYQDPNKPLCEKEIVKVDYFDLSSQSQIENKQSKVCDFASGVMRKVDVKKLL